MFNSLNMKTLTYIPEKEKMGKNDFCYEKILKKKKKTGDRSSFSSIFSFYFADLAAFANIFVKDQNYAKEIVQDTFVYLWENHEILMISSSLKSYLLKMVQNRCLNWLKHLKTRDSHREFILHNSSIFERDTDNYILKSELESKIESVLNKLPNEVKEAFLMNKYEDKKYQEIADIQIVSVRTIEDRIGKALNLLKQQLNEFLIAAILSILLIY